MDEFDKERVTLKRLHKEVESQLGFEGGVSSVRKLIRELSFRWRRTQDNRKMLLERHDGRTLSETDG
jgi:transposase